MYIFTLGVDIVAQGKPLTFFLNDIDYLRLDNFTASIWIRLLDFNEISTPIKIAYAVTIQIDIDKKVLVPYIQGGTLHTNIGQPEIYVEGNQAWFRLGITKNLTSYTVYHNLKAVIQKNQQVFSDIQRVIIKEYQTSENNTLNQNSFGKFKSGKASILLQNVATGYSSNWVFSQDETPDFLTWNYLAVSFIGETDTHAYSFLLNAIFIEQSWIESTKIPTFTKDVLYIGILDPLESVVNISFYMRELRVWNPARSQNDLLQFRRKIIHDQYPAGLLTYWSFFIDDSYTTNIMDQSYNNYGLGPFINSNKIWDDTSQLILCCNGTYYDISSQSCQYEADEKEYILKLIDDSTLGQRSIVVQSNKYFIVEFWLMTLTDSAQNRIIKIKDGSSLDQNYLKASFYFNQQFVTDIAGDASSNEQIVYLCQEGLFQGYLKELRYYSDFGDEVRSVLYMVLRNFRSELPNPTAYPYLIGYYKFTVPEQFVDKNSPNFLQNKYKGNMKLLRITLNYQCVKMGIFGMAQPVDIKQKADGTVNIISSGALDTLMNIKMTRMPAGTTKYQWILEFNLCYNELIAPSSQLTNNDFSNNDQGWIHFTLSSIDLQPQTLLINTIGDLIQKKNTYQAHASCQESVPSKKIELKASNEDSISLKDFAFVLDAFSYNQLSVVALLDSDNLYGWIQEDQSREQDQLKYLGSGTQGKRYFEWVFDPMSPQTCNNTDQYIPHAFSCGQNYYRYKKENQCIWIKLVKYELEFPANMTYIQLGQSEDTHIGIRGINTLEMINNTGGVSGKKNSYLLAANLKAQIRDKPFNIEVETEMSVTYQDRCYNYYCYMFLTVGKNLTTGESQLSLFTNSILIDMANFSYDSMIIDDKILIGCSEKNLAANESKWEGFIQQVRVFFSSTALDKEMLNAFRFKSNQMDWLLL
ncbi:UNKNOWN [Stylonychia lemnae]|uniref:Uncharacterized protein n=1 Tax=Stylonychia lemnae TaxID=5949 RepID=A0A078AN36_STYLE|nr:UNKNOWN [Stylonychia lemnae]|eukprot:CDW83341.1 UNKNOWN [Stylonychia lemnae]